MWFMAWTNEDAGQNFIQIRSRSHEASRLISINLKVKIVHVSVKKQYLLDNNIPENQHTKTFFNQQDTTTTFQVTCVCIGNLQYIPRNMHTVFALLCFVVVIHWLIFPYPSGLLHWHCCNLTIAPRASKATLMNIDKYFMWIHYERLHNHNKAKHNKTVCIFLGIYCRTSLVQKMSCCLFSTKPLSEPMLEYCQLNRLEIIIET